MERFDNHTFVICAYKESKYLEECIKSLKNQSIKSNIIISTSTPNNHIKSLALKYDIDYLVNKESKGIGADWNFAVSVAKTDFVTLAHQDDCYAEKYTEELLKVVKKYNDIQIVFTNCKEIRNRRSCKKEFKFENKIFYDFSYRIV